ncbi:MAG: T9SS type A sorting domain-containing protein [Dysgonomonas sp.]
MKHFRLLALLFLLAAVQSIKSQNLLATFTTTTTGQKFSVTMLTLYDTNIKVDWGTGTPEAISITTGTTKTVESPNALTGASSVIKIYADDLYYLAIGGRNITNIQFAPSTTFKQLIIEQNPITSLNVSMLPNLNFLVCSNTSISSIDLSQNPELVTFTMSGISNFSSIDLSSNTKLVNLDLNKTKITSLDLSHNTLLKSLSLSKESTTSDADKFASLSLSGLTQLESLSCAFNKLTALDLSNSPNLKELVCGSNRLKSINLSSSVTELSEFQCENNALTFATLPRIKKAANVGNFTYSPQDSLVIIPNNERVCDLSAEYSVTGNNPAELGTTISTFDWRNVTRGVNLTSPDDYTNANGVFTFTTTNISSSDNIFLRRLRNAAYPGLILASYQFDFSGSVDIVGDEYNGYKYTLDGRILSFSEASAVVELYNLSGQKKIEVKSVTSVDLSGLPAGTYVVYAKSNNGVSLANKILLR